MIADSLPAIDGWRLEAEIISYADIGQCRIDHLGLEEYVGLAEFEAAVAIPETEAMRYRQKLARARQLLVRRRGTELVQTVDELLAPVPTDDELAEAEASPLISVISEAVNEIERLLGDALTAWGPFVSQFLTRAKRSCKSRPVPRSLG